MSLFKAQRTVGIVAISGTVSVTVNLRPASFLLFIEVLVAVVVNVTFFRAWTSISRWYRILLIWTVASEVIAWLYQLSGSEVVEFDAQKVIITK